MPTREQVWGQRVKAEQAKERDERERRQNRRIKEALRQGWNPR